MRSIARDLTGDLPCARCRYNLRGLSIRGGCPECDLPVRTTILVLVDPKAEEFEPLRMPRTTAIGLIAWALGGFGVVAAVWVLRVGELLSSLGPGQVSARWWSWFGIGSIAVSALGSTALIRPTARTPVRDAVRALVGVLLYVPVGVVFWQIHVRIDGAHAAPYAEPSQTEELRTVLRLVMGALAVAVIILLRANARGLSLRSHLLRTGQVDRQSLLGLTVAFGVAALGDVVMVLVEQGVLTSEYMRTSGVALIALGSFLITVGLFAVVLDTVRLYGVISRPALGLSHVLESNSERAERLGEGSPAP